MKSRRLIYLLWAGLLLPVFTLLYLSVVSSWAFPYWWEVQWSGQTWRRFWAGDYGLSKSLVLSLGLGLSLSVAATTFGFQVTRVLLFEWRRSAWIRWAFFPYLIAPVVLGAMLQYFFLRAQLSGTVLGVWLAQALFVFPYSVLLFSTFWNPQIYQLAGQAATLGATPRQVYRRLIRPLARPWVALSLVQCFLISWFEYGMTRMIGLGKVRTLTVQIMHLVQEANPHLAAAAGLMMILPLLLLAWIGIFFFFPGMNRVH